MTRKRKPKKRTKVTINQDGRRIIMQLILDELKNAKSIVISGHVRPDGDCVGSCLALYQYLSALKKELQIEKVTVVLEEFADVFSILPGSECVEHQVNKEPCDLFISLDCGSVDRLGEAIYYHETAKRTVNIDHHISNIGFCDINHIEPDASSTSEVLYKLFDKDKISYECAECLYNGIIHDTGVFKHSNTTRTTLEAAGDLIEKGFSFSKLIDETFYQKTYMQNKLLGECLLSSYMELDGKCILSVISKDKMEEYHAVGTDLEGVIDQLRVTKGVEVAVFLHEMKKDTYKLSMRSNGEVNVSEIACHFGGGGHVKAAGATLTGNLHILTKELLNEIKKQLP